MRDDLGIDIANTHYAADMMVRNVWNEGGRLVPDETEENILDYDDNGVSWKDIENGAIVFEDDKKTP